MGKRGFRAAILHCLADPAVAGDAAWEYFADGLLVVADGKVVAVGDYTDLMSSKSASNSIADCVVVDYRDKLIVPGFIDTHIHYPQTDMIGAYGAQLLDWLETYTFPEEAKFADESHARDVAERFLNELMRNGTTTALVFGTVHPQSVDAFFQAAQQRHLRMIAGKVLMDRNAPENLRDTAEQGYTESKALIQRWHGKDRLLYAVTPRFAPTSSREQLDKAGELLQEFPNVYLHTHLAENEAEIAWVAELFPESENYLDVYEHSGLLGQRSVFAHGVHLCDSSCERLAATNSVVAHCPTSNLFLGSGLFPLRRLQQHGVRVGLGTDVGAGTSFSMLQTMGEAYKVQQLQGESLPALEALYLATLGGAKALSLDHCIGNFKAGKEADFVVLDLAATPLLASRTAQCRTIQETLFVLNTLADDRAVAATYILGEQAQFN